ncbi:MAG TPA: response regulator [Blastocatellia bacterium]|nr:response regulator [Blastocatellia bacterium]
MTRILVIDDEPTVADALEIILSDEGYDVVVAATGRDGLEQVIAGSFDITITDLRLPDMTGHDVLARIMERDPASAVIIITAHSSPEVIEESIRLGAVEVLPKPFFPNDVIKLIAGITRRQSCLVCKEKVS